MMRSNSLGLAALRRFAQILVSFVILLGVGALAAGRGPWPRLWILVGLGAALVVSVAIPVLRVNPEAIVGRSRIGPGTKRFEKIILPLYSLASLAAPALAGLDTVRLGNPTLPIWTLPLGVALYGLGSVPVAWAMMVNPYLEQTVRVQRDRGHRVVTTGPYRVVRHPMYVGIVFQQIASALILGSSWAFASVALTIGLLVARTAFEDRALRAELEGYEAYTTQTRYRLFPGVW